MEVISEGNTRMERNAEKEFTIGLMGPTTLGIGNQMKCMEEGYLTGQMEGNLMEHSFKVSWREKEHMNGKMGENT